MVPWSGGFPDDSEDVTPGCDGGVKKVILRVSNDVNGFLPRVGDTVKVHYTGFFEDGNHFTTSRDINQPRAFLLGRGEVLKGWEVGVATMKIGEVAIFRCSPYYAYGNLGLPPVIGPDTRVYFELELLNCEGEDISKMRDRGVTKTILVRVASDGESPYDNALCTVNYKCQLYSKPSSIIEKRDNLTFVLGEGFDQGLIPVFERSIKKMKMGERLRLKIISRYAYGAKGCEKLGVPPDSDLIYYVELVDFKQTKQHWEMSRIELAENAEMEREQALELYKLEKYYMAVKKFSRALLLSESIAFTSEEMEFLEHSQVACKISDMTTLAVAENVTPASDPDSGSEAGDGGDRVGAPIKLDNELISLAEKKHFILLTSLLNLSLSHLKIGNNLRAYSFAERVLAMDPRNVKALYRKALAYYNMGNYNDAKDLLLAAKELEPENKAVLKHLRLCSGKSTEQSRRDRAIYTGMFRKFNLQDLHRDNDEFPKADIFTGVGEWDNKMADGMMTLEQEMAAFGETMPERGYDKENENPGSEED